MYIDIYITMCMAITKVAIKYTKSKLLTKSSCNIVIVQWYCVMYNPEKQTVAQKPSSSID